MTDPAINESSEQVALRAAVEEWIASRGMVTVDGPPLAGFTTRDGVSHQYKLYVSGNAWSSDEIANVAPAGDADSAIRLFMQVIDAEMKTKYIVWRIYPEITYIDYPANEQLDIFAAKGWKVRCRLYPAIDMDQMHQAVEQAERIAALNAHNAGNSVNG